MKNQYMLISFPGQGTDFFMDCLCKSNNNIKYYREFFNPICSIPNYKTSIESAFGCELNPKKIFFNDQAVLENVFKNTWPKTDFNFTKEVFSFTKVSFYNKHFKLFALYRHRNNTFPTTRGNYILPIFDAFLSENFECELKNEIKFFLKNIKTNNLTKQVLSHIFCWFIQFHEIQKNNIQVIKYYPLTHLEKEDLDQYLKENLFEELNCSLLHENIISKRNKEIRKKRYEEYNNLGVEEVCVNFIKFLRKLDTKLEEKYWEMLS